jgi:hypothetical protein
MKKMRALLLSTAAAMVLSAPAMAASLTFTDVSTSFADNAGIIEGPGFSGADAPWTTPILLTTSTGETFVTYCDDLFHNITIEQGQNLNFTTGLVTTNGIGGELTESESNIMGQLTTIGLNAFDAGFDTGNFDLTIAAQAAIWSIEYTTPNTAPVTSPNATVESDIVMLLDTVHNDGTGFAHGLISLDGTQDQILPSAIPEPSTWAMIILGAASILAFKRRGKKCSRAIS